MGLPPKIAQSILREDIRRYAEEQERRIREMRVKSNALMSIDELEEGVREVAHGCVTVSKLLDKVAEQADYERPDELQDQQQLDTAAETDEITTLRTLASDDTSLETASVADYAAEAPPPPPFGPKCITESADEMKASSQKLVDSLAVMRDVISNSAQWWVAPTSARRLKTYAIRINYHARKVKKWANQVRAHLFVSSSIVNRTTEEAAAELVEVQKQESALRIRKDRYSLRSHDLDQSLKNVHAEIEALEATHRSLEEQMNVMYERRFHTTATPFAIETVVLLEALMPHFEERGVDVYARNLIDHTRKYGNMLGHDVMAVSRRFEESK